MQERELHFENLGEVMPEVLRLKAGCRPLGNWSLAQTCTHLAASFDGSIDGFGTNRHWVMRTLFGRRALREVFQSGELFPGFTVSDALNPPDDAELDVSMASLERSVDRFMKYEGALQVHPFFGRLSRSEWVQLHRIHCGHHLRRLVPAMPLQT